MSRADEMRALIARVEAATWPDRELDAEIAVATTPGMIRDFEYVGFTGAGDMYPAPAYTGSLDAAVSLASDWAIASLGDMVADGLPGAVLLISTDPVKHVTGIGYGTRESGCLARALTAAALRARLAMEEGA